MANRNGPRNDANRPGPSPKTDKVLLDQAVRSFVENGFETSGNEFYQKFLDGRPLEKDFISFLETKEGLKSVLPEWHWFPNSLFTTEIRKAAFSLENLRKAAKEAFALEYDVPAQKQGDLERRITELRPSELKELVGSAKERAETVRWVTKKRPETIRKGWKEYLDTLQSSAGFDSDDRARLENYVENAKWISNVENARTAFRMGTVSEDEIRTILGLIRTPEAKRALVKALMPKIAISELVRMKIFGLTEAREAVVKKIMQSGAADDFSKLLLRDAESGLPSKMTDEEKRIAVEKKIKTFVEDFDLAHFYVDTLKIADEDLDIVLEKSDLPKILEEKISEGMEELKRALDPEKDLEADVDGNLAISFAEKITKEFSGNDDAGKNIRNVELFLDSATWAKNAGGQVQNDAVLEWIVKNDAGVGERVRLKIKKWLEFPPNNERKIAIAYLDENGTETNQDAVTYDEFYRLAYRLENREFLDTESLGRKIRTEDAANKRVLAEAENAATPEERQALLDTIAPVWIEDIGELEEMFDDIDPNGKTHGIKAGISVTLGKPGDAKYNIVTIESVDLANKKINVLDTRIRNGDSDASRRSSVPFGEFYRVCRVNWAVRSLGINSPERILSTLDSSVVRGYFEGLSIGWDADSMKFVPKDKRWQQDYEGVKVFYKQNGTAIQIGEMENGRVQIRMLDSFESGNQSIGEKPKGTSSSQFQWYGYETLYMLIRNHELVPHVGIAWELVVKQPEFESKGRIKKLLDHPSIYDFIHGLQEIPKFVKKKLEHSSHHHAAHMTLAIAGKIPGFPDDWLTDLQMEIHNEDKSTLRKEVDRLNSFSSPKRHEQALRYLKDEGARDYEVIAATLSLLEKHGNLYPGVLAKYEKDWLFYARMPGSAKEKEEFLRKKRVNPDGTEREVKEPEIIMLWLMELSKKEHHPLSPYYWLEVKKMWKAGSSAEFEAGGNEGKQLETLTKRADHAINKLKGKEYAHAIGAMEQIWDKPNDLWGNVSWRMRVPFVMAMCNARGNIHSEIAQKFVPMFDSWHTYPPLLFIQNKDRQDVFRKVIEKLSAEAGGAMAEDFRGVKRLMEESSVSMDGRDEALIGELDKFWAKHGNVLSKKLLISVEDPEIFVRKNEAPFGEYLKIVGGEYGNTKFDGAEIDCWTYEISGANWSLAAPGAYVRQFKIQAGHGWFNSELEIYLFDKYMAAIDTVRKTEYSSDPARNIEIKKLLFGQYHKAFLQYVQERLSPDKFNDDPRTGRPKLEQETYMKRLNERFGFTAPRSKDAAEFEGTKYDDWMEADFNRFMSIKSVWQFGAAVATNVWGIIGTNSLPHAPLPPNRGNRGGGQGGNPWTNAGGGQGGGNAGGGTNGPTPTPSPTPSAPSTPSGNRNGTNGGLDIGNVPSIETPENPNSSETALPESSPEAEERGTEPSAEFRTHFEPIVDRIVWHFGSQPLVYARGRSHEMASALRKAGMDVPTDVRNSEWALSKIVERFLELEVQDSFEKYETGFVGNEFLRNDEIYVKVGEAALSALRHGATFKFDHIDSPESQIYLHMLFREGVTWQPDDLRKIGKVLMDAA